MVSRWMNDEEESNVQNDTATQKVDEVSSNDCRTSSISDPQYDEAIALLLFIQIDVAV